MRRTLPEEMIGRKFANLTVVAESPKTTPTGGTMWLCNCECGGTAELATSVLRRGATKSCGCLRGKNAVDMTKQVWGMLTAVEPRGSNKAGDAIWLFQCSCGESIVTLGNSVRRGLTQSCGCLVHNPDPAKRSARLQSRSSEYRSYRAMLQRCNNPQHDNYPLYGGRGITVCDAWASSFLQFYADMGSKPSRSHTIDRIDTNGNYEPVNCRWATPKEQRRNRRSNHNLTHNGITRCITEWAEETGLPKYAIRSRIVAGWSVDAALTTPLRSGGDRKSSHVDHCKGCQKEPS